VYLTAPIIINKVKFNNDKCYSSRRALIDSEDMKSYTYNAGVSSIRSFDEDKVFAEDMHGIFEEQDYLRYVLYNYIVRLVHKIFIYFVVFYFLFFIVLTCRAVALLVSL
jgi:hypothetical protein